MRVQKESGLGEGEFLVWVGQDREGMGGIGGRKEVVVEERKEEKIVYRVREKEDRASFPLGPLGRKKQLRKG